MLLAALLRWGVTPAALQALLSAYTAAALRVARHAAASAREGDGAGGAADSGSPAAALAAAREVTQQLCGMQADMRLLGAACDALGALPAPCRACDGGGSSGHEGAWQQPGAGDACTCSAADGDPPALQHLRAFWFDPARGFALLGGAQALQAAAAAAPGDGDACVAAVASGLLQCAVARDAGGSAAAQEEAAALACALAVQPCWPSLCACLLGSGSGAPGLAGVAPSADSGSDAALAAGHAAAAELGAALEAAPLLAVTTPPPALAAACWAQPRVAAACWAALGSAVCVADAADCARAAGRLRQLLAMLHALGCSACWD